MKYMKLTPEQKKAYLQDSSKCPYCGAEGVEGGEVQDEGDQHFQNITCSACNREWVDIYTLSDVDDGEQTCALCNEIIQEGDEVDEGNYGLVHSNCPDFQDDEDQ